MVNEEIRAAIKTTGVRQWMVAEALGIHESVFTRKLRHELPSEERTVVLRAVYTLAEQNLSKINKEV